MDELKDALDRLQINDYEDSHDTSDGYVSESREKDLWIVADDALNTLHSTGLTPAQLAEQNKQLRRLLAVAYSGANLYMDDGELQDNTNRPYIDYVRMTPEQIEAAFHERGKASCSSKYPPAGDDES